MREDDWRPLVSEQIQEKKIIFTVEDKFISTDIQGDNKLYIFDWADNP